MHLNWFAFNEQRDYSKQEISSFSEQYDHFKVSRLYTTLPVPNVHHDHDKASVMSFKVALCNVNNSELSQHELT